MPSDQVLEVGDPAPWFRQRSTSTADYWFDTVAGRYVVLCFFGSAAQEAGRRMLGLLSTHRALFDDEHLAFFGVSIDPEDQSSGRIQAVLPGIRFFWDFDGLISRL